VARAAGLARPALAVAGAGGVGGPLFRQYAAEVERRLWNCPAYRILAPSAATN